MQWPKRFRQRLAPPPSADFQSFLEACSLDWHIPDLGSRALKVQRAWRPMFLPGASRFCTSRRATRWSGGERAPTASLSSFPASTGTSQRK